MSQTLKDNYKKPINLNLLKKYLEKKNNLSNFFYGMFATNLRNSK
jgi:hypothetical protein